MQRNIFCLLTRFFFISANANSLVVFRLWLRKSLNVVLLSRTCVAIKLVVLFLRSLFFIIKNDNSVKYRSVIFCVD